MFIMDLRAAGWKGIFFSHHFAAAGFGHPEKYRFAPEAALETHVLAGVGLRQWSGEGRFFELPLNSAKFDCI